MSFNVAIDGPAGAGKSTIAKLVANVPRHGTVHVKRGCGSYGCGSDRR